MPLNLLSTHFSRRNLSTIDKSPDQFAPDSALYHLYLTSAAETNGVPAAAATTDSPAAPRDASASVAKAPLATVPSPNGTRKLSRQSPKSNHQRDHQPQREEALLTKNAAALDTFAASMANRRHPPVSSPPKPPLRDSHDLSISGRDVTRDSLVTNMLMSLDQLSTLQKNTPRFNERDEEDDDLPRFFDIPRYRADNHAPPQATQPAATHGRSFSYSSDASRLSSQYSRDRRSNSTATMQDHPRRSSLIRDSMRRSQSDTPREQSTHRGHKSGSIGGGSIDSTQYQTNGQGNARSGRGHRRSSSMDRGSYQKPSPDPHQLESTNTQTSFRPNTNSMGSEELNVAPVPSVPSGPRSNPPNSFNQNSSNVQQTSNSHRNRSTSRSAKSASGRGKTQPREQAPPLPTGSAVTDADSAPAPAVGYGKPKEPATSSQHANNNATPQPKEKQGFFKRVFGVGSRHSSSSSTAPSPDPSQAARRNTGDSPAADSPNSSSQRVQSTSTKTPPPTSRDTASSHSNHPTLQKKTSFFRRRKKSVHDEAPPVSADENAPPVPPLSLYHGKDNHKSIPKPETSPVSSLRQVMNPYLNEASPARPVSKPPTPGKITLADLMGGEEEDDDVRRNEGYQRGFSPDYDPSPNAQIRKVQSNLSQDQAEIPTTPSRVSGSKAKKTDSFLDLDGPSETDDSSNRSKDRTARDLFGSQVDGDKTPRQRDVSTLAPETLSGPDDTTPKAPSVPFTDASHKHHLPDLRIETTLDSGDKVMSPLSMDGKPLDEPEFILGMPTEDDAAKAQKIYDGNEDFIQKEKAAAWMGEEGPVRKRTLYAYMSLYEFTNQSIVYSLRQVCSRLVLRAETQQVDRILLAFSKRWCACNTTHGFKATDVIHTICYSIMLLNTDLHMADIEQKMTRSQFVKNTMGTIIQALSEVMPDALEKRPSILPGKPSSLMVDTPTSLASPTPISPASTEQERRSFRNSFRPPPRTESEISELANDCGPLVKSPHTGSMKAWEEQVEIVLKATYNSIRDERLPLFGADPQKSLPNSPAQGLSVMNMLRRTPSVLSKTPSEGNLSMRGRNAESTRGPGSRWVSKSRSRPPPGLGRNGFNSSRTSFEDNNSLWSPALSSATWSRHSLGRTQTSVSQDSFASAFPRGDYQQSIGFANALSQAIIRDEDPNGCETAPSILSADLSSSRLLEDETLEITGPPWVKEGRVIHKHHLDGIDKKSKDRHWSEVFAVIQKGQMSLFSFNATKSMKEKNRSKLRQEVVGGGNWQDKATNVGTFNLQQTLASALPSPGYSRARPHVWALSLPTGAVHLFQVGTPEIIKEFVTTANYWSARLSTHPLTGAIGNMEYGWGESIVNNALVSAINETTGPTNTRRASNLSNTGPGRKSSISSSFRSTSIDQAASAFTHASGRGKLPGDRVAIADWTPPTQSLRPSSTTEAEQLSTLVAYVKNIEDSLQAHNQLRSPMLLAFTPRGSNANKAMANWEKKSAYLLREIVKFRTYVDCLQQAEARKEEIYADRNLAHRAARGELIANDVDVVDNDADITLRY